MEFDDAPADQRTGGTKEQEIVPWGFNGDVDRESLSPKSLLTSVNTLIALFYQEPFQAMQRFWAVIFSCTWLRGNWIMNGEGCSNQPNDWPVGGNQGSIDHLIVKN